MKEIVIGSICKITTQTNKFCWITDDICIKDKKKIRQIQKQPTKEATILKSHLGMGVLL